MSHVHHVRLLQYVHFEIHVRYTKLPRQKSPSHHDQRTSRFEHKRVCCLATPRTTSHHPAHHPVPRGCNIRPTYRRTLLQSTARYTGTNGSQPGNWLALHLQHTRCMLYSAVESVLPTRCPRRQHRRAHPSKSKAAAHWTTTDQTKQAKKRTECPATSLLQVPHRSDQPLPNAAQQRRDTTLRDGALIRVLPLRQPTANYKPHASPLPATFPSIRPTSCNHDCPCPCYHASMPACQHANTTSRQQGQHV